jgi:hypothetical protein
LPSARAVADLLARLGETLAAAGRSASAEELARVRQVVQLLTGGRIDLVQQGERKAQRGWLRGRFRLRLLSSVVAQITGVPAADTTGPEMVIDYREPGEAERWADRVKELYDAGLLIKAIAARLGISRNLVRAALACWGERQGAAVPDGRSRRATLRQKHLQPPPYQAIADQVKALYDEGLLLGEMAARLGHDRATVAQAVAFWHTSRGLPVPDGRSRRKGLKRPAPDVSPGQDHSPLADPPEAGAKQ